MLNCFLVHFSIFVQLLDRSQQHLLMLRVPLTFFVPMTTPITQLQNLPPAIPMVDVLAEESTEVWINVREKRLCLYSAMSSVLLFV